jgi:hypothetical protein
MCGCRAQDGFFVAKLYKLSNRKLDATARGAAEDEEAAAEAAADMPEDEEADAEEAGDDEIMPRSKHPKPPKRKAPGPEDGGEARRVAAVAGRPKKSKAAGRAGERLPKKGRR